MSIQPTYNNPLPSRGGRCYGASVEILLVILVVPAVLIAALGSAAVLVRFMFRELERAVETSNKVMVETVSKVSEVVRDASSSATTAALNAWMASTVGEVGQPVPQPSVPDDGNISSPHWMTWGDEGADATVPGVGDSVWFERVYGGEDRAAPIGEGEPIILGVPLPDMSGEEYGG